MTTSRISLVIAFLIMLLAVGCSTTSSLTERQADVDYDLLLSLPSESIDFDGRRNNFV